MSPPCRLHSIGLARPDVPGVIPLRDPATDELQPLPEWVRGERNYPSAFVAGTVAKLSVRFAHPARSPGRGGTAVSAMVGADADGDLQVIPRRVAIRFDEDGLSSPFDFLLSAPLPAGIDTTTVRWRWWVELDGTKTPIGTSEHVLFTTWKRPTDCTMWQRRPIPDDPPDRLPGLNWVYLPLMRWTCAWARGATDERAICDAIIANLRESGLKYHVTGGYQVRKMLLIGGGFCGGWYRMFQAMAGAQGVPVVRRSFLVNWQVQPNDEARWCAIVVRKPGLNRREPPDEAVPFHDVRAEPVDSAPVETVEEGRHRFWGQPGGWLDGHCICFLPFGSSVYLYDPSFLEYAVELTGFTIPKVSVREAVDPGTQGDFKAAYLDRAVDYMLGSVRNHGTLYETKHPSSKDGSGRPRRTVNGLSVRTSLLGKSAETVSFFWGP